MNGRRMGDGPPVGTPVVVGAGRWAMGDGRMEIGAAMEDFEVMADGRFDFALALPRLKGSRF